MCHINCVLIKIIVPVAFQSQHALNRFASLKHIFLYLVQPRVIEHGVERFKEVQNALLQYKMMLVSRFNV